ncbi:MAG: hypothetical protein ACI4TM_09795, partial [Candidatus Cryptobacteroides sp.]
MNKKTILWCIAALVVMMTGVAVALFYLYAGDGTEEEVAPHVNNPEDLMLAVPSDALAVASFASPSALSSTFADSQSPLALISDAEKSSFSILFRRMATSFPRGGQTVFSIHYNSRPEALLTLDMGKSGKEAGPAAVMLMHLADSLGLYSQFVDGQPMKDAAPYIRKKSFLMIGSADLLVKSGLRHVERGLSIYDCDAFNRAVAMSPDGNRIFFSNTGVVKLLRKALSDKPSTSAKFIGKVAEWTVLKIENCQPASLSLTGKSVCGVSGDDYWNVFKTVAPDISSVADILPSYTIFALSIPMKDVDAHITAHRNFLDSGSGLTKYTARLDTLRKRVGISPVNWAKALNIKELSYAKFAAGDSIREVLLIRPGKQRSEELTMKYYPGFAAALFGKLFSLDDESCCEFVNG